VLEGLEHEARAKRKGLWMDPQPVPRGVAKEKNIVSRQTLFLFAELGFCLHLSRWDRDFPAKIIFVAVHRHQINPATYESAVRSQLPLRAAGLRDSPLSQSFSTSQPIPDSRSELGTHRHTLSPGILH
jgi:hypothetical protein